MNKLFNKIKELIKSWVKDPLFLRHWEELWYSRHRNDNQLSVSIRVPGRKERLYAYKGDGRMFIEDMTTGIMPFTIYKGVREKYPVRVEPSLSREQEGMIAEGISGRDHAFFLEDGLCEFVRETTHDLFLDGVTFYEIVYKRNNAGQIESFEFEHISPYYLFKFWKNYYQFIPWWVAKESKTRVQIVKIPTEKVLRIGFPKELGGKRVLFRTLKRLWQLSKEFMPEFYMQAMSKNENIGFNPDEFYREKYLEIAKVTQQFGWSQRQRSDNYITEYYSMVRFLRHKKLEALFRKIIISKLNEVLNRTPLNLNVTLSIENLPSIEDIEKQEELLKNGGVAFMDIFNAVKISD